jgi:hypothetical protein
MSFLLNPSPPGRPRKTDPRFLNAFLGGEETPPRLIVAAITLQQALDERERALERVDMDEEKPSAAPR